MTRSRHTRQRDSHDEHEELHARRLVVQRCLYGVDKKLSAVELAKLSLWLATLAREHEFTFLDHALKCGDSLVGLTIKQIKTLAWSPRLPASTVVDERLAKDLPAALAQRAEIYRRRMTLPLRNCGRLIAASRHK